MLEEQKNKIILGKYKIREGILNLISIKDKDTLKLYKQFLNKNLKTLKRIDATSTRAAIEMKINKKASYPAFDWQVELVSLNNIFALMLGVIDARIDDYQRDLEFQKHFNDREEIQEIEFKLLELCECRMKVVQDFETIFKKDDMTVIKETIQHNPSYKNFDNLFKDMKENHYNLSIQGQLISSYMLGYNNSLYIQPQDIMPYYNQIISEYKLNKARNSRDYQKVKSLEK